MTDDGSSVGQVVAGIVLQQSSVDLGARLEDVRFDSLARVLLIGEVHDRLGIVVEPATMDSWITVADMVDFVDGHASPRG